MGAVDGTATSNLSHGAEPAGSGAYTVAPDDGVTTELTATARPGMACFTFPVTGKIGVPVTTNSGRATSELGPHRPTADLSTPLNDAPTPTAAGPFPP
ncbi:hypothetical protein [Streptosporangium subroseum]|uniref:hypothetical protein n=1 Tax=Streptosporangium subroseum TaxID=106412 RepID=UPI003B830076